MFVQPGGMTAVAALARISSTICAEAAAWPREVACRRMKSCRPKGPKIGLALLLGGALWLGAAPAFAASASCEAPVSPPLHVDQVKGVRTKWLSFSPDERNSIEPDLAHLTLRQWMDDLHQAGVNLAEINLEPTRLLADRPAVPDADLMHAATGFYTPASQIDAAWRQQVAGFVNDIVPHHSYTPAQRNAVLLDFLRRLEDLRRRGEIDGSIRFLMHQRLWFPHDVSAENRELRAAQFSNDMASFINLAEQNCLGHWLAGIRLGEHNNNDMNELLPLIVRLARGVNERAGGWLKTHLFVADGGGMGPEYRGINHVLGRDGQPYPFFRDIAEETGAFTFGYKFEFLLRTDHGIRGHMMVTQCGPQRYCNPDSVSDWEEYLGKILGFDELVSFLGANRARYPLHANVVFVGDITDAAVNLVYPANNGALEDRPSMTAVRQLFIKAGPMATSGKIFMNGFNTEANMRLQNYREGKQVVDIGRAFYFVDSNGEARFLPQSYRIWKDWPQP